MSAEEAIYKQRMNHLMGSVESIVSERFSDEAAVLVVVYEKIGDGGESESLMIGSCRVLEPNGIDAFLMTALVARGVLPDGTVEHWLSLKGPRPGGQFRQS